MRQESSLCHAGAIHDCSVRLYVSPCVAKSHTGHQCLVFGNMLYFAMATINGACYDQHGAKITMLSCFEGEHDSRYVNTFSSQVAMQFDRNSLAISAVVDALGKGFNNALPPDAVERLLPLRVGHSFVLKPSRIFHNLTSEYVVHVDTLQPPAPPLPTNVIWGRNGITTHMFTPRRPENGERKRVAVIYSGRWWGALAAPWVQNHLVNLLWPNQATVFVLVDHLNACHASTTVHSASHEADAEVAFTQEVRDVFQHYPRLYATLVPSTRRSSTDGDAIWNLAASVLRWMNSSVNPAKRKHVPAMLRVWLAQFSSLARAEDLRRAHGPHELVLRARLDLLFHHPVQLWRLPLSISDRRVFALGIPTMLHVDSDKTSPGYIECYSDPDRHAGGSDLIETLQREARDGMYEASPADSTTCQDVKKVEWCRAKRHLCEADSEAMRERCCATCNLTLSGGNGVGWADKEEAPSLLHLTASPDASHVLSGFEPYLLDEGRERARLRPCSADVPLRWQWRDWIYLGTPRGIAPLAAAPRSGVVLASARLRCHGLCPEEQNQLRLQEQNISLVPLPWAVHLAHMPCQHALHAKPLLNASAAVAHLGVHAHHLPCRIIKASCKGLERNVSALLPRINSDEREASSAAWLRAGVDSYFMGG